MAGVDDSSHHDNDDDHEDDEGGMPMQEINISLESAKEDEEIQPSVAKSTPSTGGKRAMASS